MSRGLLSYLIHQRTSGHPCQMRNLILLIQSLRILALRLLFTPSHLFHWPIEGLPTADLPGHRKKLLINQPLLPSSPPTTSTTSSSFSSLSTSLLSFCSMTTIKKLQLRFYRNYFIIMIYLVLPHISCFWKDLYQQCHIWYIYSDMTWCVSCFFIKDQNFCNFTCFFLSINTRFQLSWFINTPDHTRHRPVQTRFFSQDYKDAE